MAFGFAFALLWDWIGEELDWIVDVDGMDDGDGSLGERYAWAHGTAPEDANRPARSSPSDSQESIKPGPPSSRARLSPASHPLLSSSSPFLHRPRHRHRQREERMADLEKGTSVVNANPPPPHTATHNGQTQPVYGQGHVNYAAGPPYSLSPHRRTLGNPGPLCVPLLPLPPRASG